ncbi:lysozyme inhibitor LprI family protein [Lysobacter brunescens]|uniref:Lysozyme inhibitor LprI family protein n=1 Tax=Lysobacter brunescens TaxID=262323 RepID=A0ABW2YH74_9GAMM
MIHARLAALPVLSACLVFLACAAPAFADDDGPHDAVCRQWMKTPIPKQDIGSAPADCDAEVLYYGRDGKGTGRDLVAARHCAYRQRGTGAQVESQSEVFGGSGILMMLYANGEGVKRNLPLAKRFACEYGGAPAEVDGRLEHIDAIAEGTDTQAMDICDDITSGLMAGFCSRRSADAARFERNQRWQMLQAAWTPAQRAAWADVRKAADDYFDLVSREETDMSGTARGAFAVGAREDLEIALLDAVTRFESGKRPTQKAGDFARADKALNATYKATLAKLVAGLGDGMFGDYGTIGPDGVRQTQRAWLRYRDAWVRFATLRWPGTPADAWKAWLTEERTKALAELVSEG